MNLYINNYSSHLLEEVQVGRIQSSTESENVLGIYSTTSQILQKNLHIPCFIHLSLHPMFHTPFSSISK